MSADTPRQTGGAFSQGSSTTGITLFTSAKDHTGGPIYRRHSESFWSSPQSFGPWYIAPLAETLIKASTEQFRHPIALRRRENQPQISLDQAQKLIASANSGQVVHWILQGHAALLLGVAEQQQALPLLKQRMAQLGGRDKALIAAARPGLRRSAVELFDHSIHQGLAMARLEKAIDRLSKAGDATHLAQWVREQGVGWRWAQRQLATLDDSSITKLAVQRLEDSITGNHSSQGRAGELWQLLAKKAPADLQRIARSVPKDGNHPFAIAAAHYLRHDPEEMRLRIPPLAKRLDKLSDGMGYQRYLIGVIIPQADPLFHDEPLIEKHLRLALSNDYAQPVTGNFPAIHARALLWRQDEVGIQEALALAERHLSQADNEFSLSDPFLFLADLAHTRPQHRNKVSQLMSDASKRLPKGEWFHCYLAAWVIDHPEIRIERTWDTELGLARFLDQAWRGDTPSKRLQGLIRLGEHGILASSKQTEPLYDQRWKEQWSQEWALLNAEQQRALASSITNWKVRNNQLGANLKDHALSLLGK